MADQPTTPPPDHVTTPDSISPSDSGAAIDVGASDSTQPEASAIADKAASAAQVAASNESSSGLDPDFEAALNEVINTANAMQFTASKPADPVAEAFQEALENIQPEPDAERSESRLFGRGGPAKPQDAADYAMADLAADGAGGDNTIQLLDDVELDVHIELGRTEMYIEDVLRLGVGSVVELDKLAGDPVDIYVNERLVARGEVLVLNENFCVRINDIVSAFADNEA